MANSMPIAATPPLLLSVTSTDNSTITLHFDHDVIAGSGNFVISDGHSQSYVGANGLTTRIVGATDTRRLDDSDSQVSYSGQDVVIHLSSALHSGLGYSITMDAGTVNEAVSGAAIGRIGSTSLFHFTASGSATLPGTPAASVGASIHFTDTGASSSDYITNALEQTVTGSYNGSLQDGEFIQVSLDNGASWHKATVNADLHSWSYSGVIATGNLTSGDGGNLNGALLARVSNLDGGGSATTSQAYVYSNHSIPIEINPTASFSADSGAANDLVTNVATQTISGIYSGVLQSGMTLQVSVDAGAHWINATASDGSWQVSGVTLLEGKHDLQMRVIDIAGNASSPMHNDYTLISQGAALTDRALTLTTGGDSGLSASDGVTNALSSLTLNVSGLHGVHIGDVFEVIDTSNNSAVVGSYTIQYNDLYYGGSDYLSVGSHNSAPRASLNITVNSGLDDGQHNLAVRLVDIAGNTGASSNSTSVTLDTQAPTVALTTAQMQLGSAGQPVFVGGTEPVPALSSDALPSIQLNLPTLAGYAVGDIIEIVDLNHGNAIVGHRTLVSGDLNSDHTLGKSNLSVTLDHTLSDGLHTLAVKLADLAGNTLGLSDQHLNLTVDTTLPTLSTSTPNADAGNVSPTDDIVLEFSEDIRIDSSTQFTLEGGNGSITLSGSDLSVTGHTLTIHHGALSHGAGYTLSLSAGSVLDTAGNAAELLPLSFTTAVDTDTPPPPTLTSIAISDDHGLYADDGITNSAPGTVNGTYTGSVTGSFDIQVAVYLGTDENGTPVGTAYATVNPDNHTWSVDVSQLMQPGSGNVVNYFVQAFVAGSVDPALTQLVSIDTESPTTSLYDLSVLSLNGASGDTHTVRDDHASMAINLSSVQLALGDVIELYDVDHNTVLDRWQVDSDALDSNGHLRGPVSLGTGTLANDDYNLAVRIADVAGNAAPHSSIFTLTLNDALVPSMEGDNFHLADGSDTGISASDNITSNAAALVVDLSDRLYLQAGDTIQVIEGDWVVSEHTLTHMELEELHIHSLSMTLAPLNDGVHYLSVRVVDALDREGAASDTLAVTVDTSAPDAQIVPAATSFAYNTSSSQTIYGQFTGPSDAVIQVWLNNEAGWQTASTYESSGTWFWSVTGTASFPTIDVRIGDAAGNLAEYPDSGRDVIVIGANVETAFDTSSGSAPIFGSTANTIYNLSEPTHNILSGGSGDGIDTVMLSFSNHTLPLSKLFGIEVINMSPTTYGGNTIVISPADVVAMTDLYSGLHKLQIDGNATSFVDLGPGWVLSNQTSGYNIYTAGGDNSIVLLVGSAIGTHLSA